MRIWYLRGLLRIFPSPTTTPSMPNGYPTYPSSSLDITIFIHRCIFAAFIRKITQRFAAVKGKLVRQIIVMGVAGAVSASVIASSPAAPRNDTEFVIASEQSERSNLKTLTVHLEGVYSAKVSLIPLEGMKARKPLAEGIEIASPPAAALNDKVTGARNDGKSASATKFRLNIYRENLCFGLIIAQRI